MSYLASESKAFSGKDDLCVLAVGRVDTEPRLSSKCECVTGMAC